MRTVRASERRTLLNSVDRPLKTGSGTVNPTSPHTILGCYRVLPGDKDAAGAGIPGLFDSLNRHRDNNVRITSSSMRISTSPALDVRHPVMQCAASSIPVGPDSRRRLLLSIIMFRIYRLFLFSTIPRYLLSLLSIALERCFATPHLLSYMQSAIWYSRCQLEQRPECAHPFSKIKSRRCTRATVNYSSYVWHYASRVSRR